MGNCSVSVVIPYYVKNSAEDLYKCLDSLCSLPKPPDEIIVVVNGNGAEKLYGRPYRIVRYIVQPIRMTSYMARNIGVSYACKDVVAFVDDDVVVTSKFVEEIKKSFSDENLHLSGGTVKFSSEVKTSFITANLAVRRSVFEHVWFDSSLYSGGDIKFAKEVIELNFRAELSINRVVVHKEETLRDRLSKSLRYGSGTTLRKLYSGWANILRDFALLSVKSLGFFLYQVTRKQFGRK